MNKNPQFNKQTDNWNDWLSDYFNDDQASDLDHQESEDDLDIPDFMKPREYTKNTTKKIKIIEPTQKRKPNIETTKSSSGQENIAHPEKRGGDRYVCTVKQLGRLALIAALAGAGITYIGERAYEAYSNYNSQGYHVDDETIKTSYQRGDTDSDFVVSIMRNYNQNINPEKCRKLSMTDAESAFYNKNPDLDYALASMRPIDTPVELPKFTPNSDFCKIDKKQTN